MWDILFDFFSGLHGNPDASGYADFVENASYLYMWVLSIGILVFIVWLFRFFGGLIQNIPHSFLKVTRVRTRWKTRKTKKQNNDDDSSQ